MNKKRMLNIVADRVEELKNENADLWKEVTSNPRTKTCLLGEIEARCLLARLDELDRILNQLNQNFTDCTSSKKCVWSHEWREWETNKEFETDKGWPAVEQRRKCARCNKVDIRVVISVITMG